MASRALCTRIAQVSRVAKLPQPKTPAITQFKYATGTGQESTYDKAKHAASDTIQNLKHKAEDLKETVVEKIHDAKEAISSRTGSVEDVKEKGAELKGRGEQKLKDLGEGAKDKAEELKQKAYEAKGKAEQKVKDVSDKFKN